MARRIQVSGAADQAALERIHEARPLGRQVVETARKLKGVKIVEEDDGRFEVTATSHRAIRELSSLFTPVRKLEIERGDELAARRTLIPVRNRKGQRILLNAESEAGAGRADMIEPLLRSFMAPRCRQGAYGESCGECWWCRKENHGTDS